MANVHFLAKDWVRDGTFSGGSWAATLPLANLKDPQPKKLARSTNDDAASTQFVVDLGRVVPVSAFALINNNFSVAATIRFRLSTSSSLAGPTIDATVNAVVANVVWGSQPWGAFPWDGIVDDDAPGGPIAFYKHALTHLGRYVGVDIVDTGNPDNYVEIGVFKAGDAFVPTINLAYGAGLAFVDPSKSERTDGGARYTDVKPSYRVFAGALEFLTETEAMGPIYDMQRLLGTSGGLLVVYDPDDDVSIVLRRTIYGAMNRLDRIVTARAGADYPYSWAFEIEEMI